MARFTGVPVVPNTGVDLWQASVLSALKENVELLIGARGEEDGASRALLAGQLTVRRPDASSIEAISARGNGVSVSGATVPTLQDYQNLVRDVQSVINDVVRLRSTVDTLVQQLRSQR